MMMLLNGNPRQEPMVDSSINTLGNIQRGIDSSEIMSCEDDVIIISASDHSFFRSMMNHDTLWSCQVLLTMIKHDVTKELIE